MIITIWRLRHVEVQVGRWLSSPRVRAASMQLIKLFIALLPDVKFFIMVQS